MTRSNARQRGFKILIGTLLLGGAVALTLASEPASEPLGTEPAPRVRTAPVTSLDATGRLRFAGAVRATDRADLAFAVGGRLAERRVGVGDRVRSGQRLARLDVRELSNAVRQAEATLSEIDARLEQRRRDLARVERLLEAKAATSEEREQIESAVRALEASRHGAEARLAEAGRQLDEGVLTAPYDGTVTEVLAEPGEYLPVGKPAMRISGTGEREVEVGLPESLIHAVRPGQRVDVELPLARSSVSGTVHNVGGSTAGAGRLFPVVVRLDSEASAAPGTAAEVMFDRPRDVDLAVPTAAVLDPGGSSPWVFAVRDSRAERVPVEVGDVVGDRVSVLGDLRPGEPVVVTGQASLTPGSLLESAPVETVGRTP